MQNESSSGHPLQVRALSLREQALFAMPTIGSQLPVTFNNGAKWQGMVGFCGFCNYKLTSDQLTGSITQLTPAAVRIEAVGVCPNCNVAVPFEYRLYDDMRTMSQQAGKWKIHSKRASWWRRMLNGLTG